MPRVLDIADDGIIALADCIANLDDRGFDATDEASLHNAALQLRRLSNNRSFLGDILIDELKGRARDEQASAGYGAQVIMLSRPNGNWFLRANIWPSRDEHMVRASGEGPFFFNLPHDHNFSFLTVGYHGPGYWSDYYEYDFDAVSGYVGEPVDLRFIERSRLEQGKLMLYRAHRDVHVQHPADALSVSINVMQMSPWQQWYDQYRFDVEAGTISGILSYAASDVALRLAAALDGEAGLLGGNGLDLVTEFARSHPSHRMRLSATEALATAATDEAARLMVWEEAARSDSALLRGEAARRLDQSA